ncbi:hypothetical protein [Fulvimarina sp. MAC8]|uniref:hypothetical protein n=1 Tax=Fulvimarina sp. MAC8 TaxID=3162874 RepID=UPI0032F06E7F
MRNTGTLHSDGAADEAATRQDRPLDKTARLAIEAGPGHGFQKAIIDMANASVDGVENETIETGDLGGNKQVIERVGVDDLAFAAKEMKIKRLVVVTPFADNSSLETVLTLSRLLTEENHPVALIQLEGSANSPIVSDEDVPAGWIDLLGGGRPVDEIIHRDPQSRLHVAPSGDVDLAALEEDQLEDLAVYIEAFHQSYAMTVVHAPLECLDLIGGLIDGETAIIIAASESKTEDVDNLAQVLNASATYDVLHLVSEGETPILH